MVAYVACLVLEEHLVKKGLRGQGILWILILRILACRRILGSCGFWAGCGAGAWGPSSSAIIFIYVTGCCTGTLDDLVDSHTKLVIYPTLSICCQRVVIHALLNTRFKGMQVVTYLANVKQLMSQQLKVPQKRSGYMHMYK